MHLPEAQLIRGATRVEIGQCVVAEPPQRLYASLGSCVGVAMFWPEKRRYGLAHVLLPARRSEKASDARNARYACSVVPHLLSLLEVPDDRKRKLRTYLAGGADLMATGDRGVGAGNCRAIREALASCGVRVTGEDVGSDSGRQLVIAGDLGEVHSVKLDDREQRVQWFVPRMSGTRDIA